jgi:hypothetical protein
MCDPVYVTPKEYEIARTRKQTNNIGCIYTNRLTIFIVVIVCWWKIKYIFYVLYYFIF